MKTMNKPVQLNRSRLLGFKLAPVAPSADGQPSGSRLNAKIGSKAGGKVGVKPPPPEARLGAKVGIKPPPPSVKFGAKVGIKPPPV